MVKEQHPVSAAWPWQTLILVLLLIHISSGARQEVGQGSLADGEIKQWVCKCEFVYMVQTPKM